MNRIMLYLPRLYVEEFQILLENVPKNTQSAKENLLIHIKFMSKPFQMQSIVEFTIFNTTVHNRSKIIIVAYDKISRAIIRRCRQSQMAIVPNTFVGFLLCEKRTHSMNI